MLGDSSRDRSRPIGLLAGSGRFPVVFAEKARDMGLRVICVGFRGIADPALRTLVERFYWCGLARLARMIGCFRREGVDTFVMAGKVQKMPVVGPPWALITMLPDLRALRMWFGRRRDNRDDSILLNVVEEFERDGVRCASALDLCPELLVKPGVLTRRQPTAAEELDVEFGWDLAKEMGRLDVGQSVAVKNRAVLVVEAIEGTDQAIVRAGELCPRGGFTVVKVAKPQQDMRFDVPTVGLSTIETIHAAGGTVLAVEACKTILLDAAETVRLADRCGITIVAR
jgi:DUF1009 family protein